MNERQSDNSNPDDFLSAYQDGELSAEERGRLEAELRASPEKQEVLRQYSQLSSWLKELPREELAGEKLPVDFQAEVMHKIQAPAGVLAAGAKRSSRLLWQVAVSLSSVAALVLVMWFARMPKAGNGPQLAQSHVEGVSAREAGGSKGNQGLDVAKNEAPVGMFSTQNTLTKDDLTDKKVADQKVEPGVELGAPAEFPFGTSDTLVRKDDPRAYQYSFSQDIARLQPGQVVSALERAGDKVSVVTLSVVDRQEALNSLRVVLAKQAVSDEEVPKPALKEMDAAAGKKVEKKSESAPQDLTKKDLTRKDFPLIAVYVQATGGQLEAAIKELKSQEQQFLSLNVEPALPGTEVEELMEEDERPLVAEPSKQEEEKRNIPAKPAPAATSKEAPVADAYVDPKRPNEGARAKSLAGQPQSEGEKAKLGEKAIVTKGQDSMLQQSRQRAVQLKRLPVQIDPQREEGAEKVPGQQDSRKPEAVPRVTSETRDRFPKRGNIVSPAPAAVPPAPATKGAPPEWKYEGKSQTAAKDSPEQPLKVLILLRQKTPQEAPISVPGGAKK